MNTQTTTAQALKSLATVSVFGLGWNVSSCTVNQMVWHVAQQAASLLFWGALAGLQSSQAQILGLPLYSLACPLSLVEYVRPVLHLLGAAI